jgi:hypothetical protein
MKWYVWSRNIYKDCVIGAWCDDPKHYRSKRAAHQAVADLSKNDPYVPYCKTQYVALPQGMLPHRDSVFREATFARKKS